MKSTTRPLLAKPSSPTPRAGVLVSLRPEFASAIAEGRKTIELRRRFPVLQAGQVMVVYTTEPVGAVVGIATIKRVQEASVQTLWRQHKNDVALSRARFNQYFDGRARGYAIHLGEYFEVPPLGRKRLAEIMPGFCAPQAWRYVDESTLQSIRSPTANMAVESAACR